MKRVKRNKPIVGRVESPKGENKDNLSRIIAVISLIVAVGAILIPYVQNQMIFDANQDILKENITVSISSNENLKPIKFTGRKYMNGNKIAQFPWHVRISNTGYSKVSVVSFNIYQKGIPGSNNSIFYSDIFGGYQIITSTAEIESFPFSLDAGESVELIIWIGIPIKQKIYDEIEKYSKLNPEYGIMQINELCARSSYDIYGNTVNATFIDDLVSIEWSGGYKNNDYYFIQFETSRGNKFHGYQSPVQSF